MGIDATRPYGREFPDVAVVPGANDFVNSRLDGSTPLVWSERQ